MGRRLAARNHEGVELIGREGSVSTADDHSALKMGAVLVVSVG